MIFVLQILMVDRDFKDIGVARFTIKSFVVKNCLPGAKLDTVLSAWNPPTEWGRFVIPPPLYLSFFVLFPDQMRMFNKQL
jgi:hypothetical protein